MSYVLLIAKDGNQPGIVEDVDLLPTNGRRPAIDEEIIITGDVFIVKDIGPASILDLKLKAINRGGALPDSSKVREPTDAFFYRNLRNVQRARSITPNRGSTPVITRNKINVSRKNNKYVFWKEKFTLSWIDSGRLHFLLHLPYPRMLFLLLYPLFFHHPL